DEQGKLRRNWREHIRNADDIWDQIVKVTRLPGTTSAPRLQPIEARLVMLQSGMRAPMGIKVKGPDLESLERAGLELEAVLKEVEGVAVASVFADRVVGKPYLEIRIDREAIGRYGIPLARVQRIIEVAIGGTTLTTTVEGRERYPVRVRYPRERRNSMEDLGRILVPGSAGEQIPLTQLASIEYVRGPQMIKSEDTFLVSYVLFDKKSGESEVEVVERAQATLQQRQDDGSLVLPTGVSYEFAGSYQNQVRSMQRLRLVIPVALLLIFLLLYLQFGRVSTTLMVFSGIAVAWAGGFLLLGLYGQGWFLDLSFFGSNLRDVFQVGPVHLSVAVWVGFLALFGIASDDGVVMASYLKQVFARRRPENVIEVRDAVLEAGRKRIRPCLMTTATTVLALLPVLSSTGRGSELMLPLAIPVFGGMLVELVTLFVVPLLWAAREERALSRAPSSQG
ncbi:MAG: efflux RND transporter permease subunit, partial [Gemmatimonadota bacterium]